MTHYRWQRRQDPGGAKKAIRQLMALSLDPREEVLFRMDRMLYAADATAGLLVFLGVSTTGSSCPDALAEATAAGIT